MGAPKKISESICTDYFSGIRPTWTKPWLNDQIIAADGTNIFDELRPNLPANPRALLETVEGRAELRESLKQALRSAGHPANRFSEIWKEDIAPEFHEAARALAKWPGFGVERDAWARSPDNAFMRIRERLMALCQAWTGYDWSRFRIWYASERALQGTARQLTSTIGRIETFRQLDNNERAVLTRHRALLGGPRWIGGFQWRSIPQRLPENHVMLGLILAVSVNRLVQRTSPAMGDPVEVTLEGGPACGLPWVALSDFATLPLEPKFTIDADDFRRRVTNLARNIARIYTRPN